MWGCDGRRTSQPSLRFHSPFKNIIWIQIRRFSIAQRTTCVIEFREDKEARKPKQALRTDLGCPHFNSCSGCALQSIDHGPLILSRARAFFVNFGISDVPFHVGQAFGWRLRARVAVRHDAENGLCVGLFEAGTHNVQPISQCR